MLLPLISDEILAEYKDVLTRNKFKIEKERIDNFFEEIDKRAIHLDRTISEETFIDEDDIVFYEVALTGKKEKETYLITGNKKHFPVKSFVVTPREMMDIIEGVKNSNKREA